MAFKPGKILARIEEMRDWHVRHSAAWAELRGIIADIREGFAALSELATRAKRPNLTRVFVVQDDDDAPDANGETEAQFEARIAAERKPAAKPQPAADADALRDGIELPTRQRGKRLTAKQQRDRAAAGGAS